MSKYKVIFKAQDNNRQTFVDETLAFFKKIHPYAETVITEIKEKNILKIHLWITTGYSRETRTYTFFFNEKELNKTYEKAPIKLTKAELEYFDRAGFQLDKAHSQMFNQYIEDWWMM